MPWGLRRFHHTGHLHSINFSCYHRYPNLDKPPARDVFELALEQTRLEYCFFVTGYVVMPNHVHLLIGEPQRGTVPNVIQSLKQSVSRRLNLRGDSPFWQQRYYDFIVWTARKRVEKLRYIHRNPVTRGLVSKPEDWLWSSYRHYLTGIEGVVEIESDWTANRRERMGIHPTVRVPSTAQKPRPSKARTGKPRES
jgi:putative transposase